MSSFRKPEEEEPMLVSIPKTGEEYLVILLKPQLIQRIEADSKYLCYEYRHMGGRASPNTYTAIPIAKLRQGLDVSTAQYLPNDMLAKEFSVKLQEISCHGGAIWCDTTYSQEFVEICENLLLKQRLTSAGEMQLGRISKVCSKAALTQFLKTQNKPHQSTVLQFMLGDLGVTDGVSTTTLFSTGSICYWGRQDDELLTAMLIKVIEASNGTNEEKMKKIAEYLIEESEALTVEDDERESSGIKHAIVKKETPVKFKKLPVSVRDETQTVVRAAAETSGSKVREGTSFAAVAQVTPKTPVRAGRGASKGAGCLSLERETERLEKMGLTSGEIVQQHFSLSKPEEQGNQLVAMVRTMLAGSASPDLKQHNATKLVEEITNSLMVVNDRRKAEELHKQLNEAPEDGNIPLPPKDEQSGTRELPPRPEKKDELDEKEVFSPNAPDLMKYDLSKKEGVRKEDIADQDKAIATVGERHETEVDDDEYETESGDGYYDEEYYSELRHKDGGSKAPQSNILADFILSGRKAVKRSSSLESSLKNRVKNVYGGSFGKSKPKKS